VRIESSVTSVSWIPSEAVTGLVLKGTFDSGLAHYDEPPPERIASRDALEALRERDGFRFANHLAAWIETDADGHVVDGGYCGGGLITTTTVRLAKFRATFAPLALPDIHHEPQAGVDPERSVEGRVETMRFVQTTGGHTGLPAPRRVSRPPFVQLRAPTVWTTLALTICADGTSSFEVVGASKFPRHWVYDDRGEIAAKVGLAQFKDWYRTAFGKYTPWGDRDSPALVTAVESALERRLSTTIMAGDEKPEIRSIKRGRYLVRQGDPGTDLFLVLDGVLSVQVDADPISELGPGAILGERAVLEGGVRTASLQARTDVRVAVARADQIDPDALLRLRAGHRNEPAAGGSGSSRRRNPSR